MKWNWGAYEAIFRYRRILEEEIVITRMLEKVLKRSDTVDRETLCIVAGQRVKSPHLKTLRRVIVFFPVIHTSLVVLGMADQVDDTFFIG